MEDEDFDNNSPIGQLIQRVNKLIKKPKIDEELSDALDIFQVKVAGQDTYLINGIFNINFAEAALFMQSCAELYCKKIDLFWDQLLEFHTRLIEYECRDKQEKGKKLDENAIQRLEERRNRYKRKKKFKLTLEQVDTSLEDFLFDKLPPVEDVKPLAFEEDDDVYRRWKKLEYETIQLTKIPRAVYIQQRKLYRLKNYRILKGQDFDILDPEDGEFLTKYSRIPGWHFIQHIFEYNTLGLLPDRNNAIATLRLSCYLRAQFMRDNKIPFNASYSEYKDKYLEFKKKFFEEEAKKWQNMPLDTMADLHRQLEYLVQKEREELAKSGIPSAWDASPFLHKAVCSISDCSVCSEDTKSSIITISDSLDFETSLFKKDVNKSELSIRIEKMDESTLPNYRKDSGYFDESFKSCDNVKECESMVESTENIEKTNEVSGGDKTKESGNSENISVIENQREPESSEAAKDTSNSDKIENNINPENTNTNEVTSDSVNSQSSETNVDAENSQNNSPNNTNENGITQSCTSTVRNNESIISDNRNTQFCETAVTNIESGVIQNNNSEVSKENINPEDQEGDHDNDDNFDTRSILSDHDYCQLPSPLNENKANKLNVQNNQMIPLRIKCIVITKPVLKRTAKENYTSKKSMGSPKAPPKRRKLSQKQIEKLLTGKICPVKENKFEKFFSMNYQPQLGEGEIPEINYDSEDEITPEEFVARENCANNDDTRSILSDHSYCQLPDLYGFPDVADSLTEQDLSTNQKNSDCEVPVKEKTIEGNSDEEILNDVSNFEDSGFNDVSSSQEDMCNSTNESINLPPPVTPRRPLGVDPEHEEEYLRILAEVREAHKEMSQELQPSLEDILTKKQKKEQEKLAAKRRVEEWREKITSVLRDVKENDFDIHEYGGRIINGMDIDETKPFKQIVDGKSSAEVVRYFIASLQLANTYNIEICGAKSGQLSNDTYGVKLLRRERHHEQLMEYHAPSEDSIREKLKKLRQMQRNKTLETEAEPSKRRRFTQANKRKGQSEENTEASSISAELPVGETPKRFKSSTNIRNPTKGKNIVMRLENIMSPHDLGVPSTSRASPAECHTFPLREEDFCEELASAQVRYPDQFSTPHVQR